MYGIDPGYVIFERLVGSGTSVSVRQRQFTGHRNRRENTIDPVTLHAKIRNRSQKQSSSQALHSSSIDTIYWVLAICPYDGQPGIE